MIPWTDEFARHTDESYAEVRKIWDNCPPGTVHWDNTFGELFVERMAGGRFAFGYEGIRGRIVPDDSTVYVDGCDSVPKDVLPYVRDRIAMPMLRIMRGAVLVHACAVETAEGGGVCMLAPSGVGKSTIVAAWMASRSGDRLISDDTLTIARSGGSGILIPGAGHIAMRHGMFDGESFVSGRCDYLGKRVLEVMGIRRARGQVKIGRVCLLGQAAGATAAYCRPVPHPLPLIPQLLSQQFSLSSPPAEFRRVQFGNMMDIIRNMTLYEAGVYIPWWDGSGQRPDIGVLEQLVEDTNRDTETPL